MNDILNRIYLPDVIMRYNGNKMKDNRFICPFCMGVSRKKPHEKEYSLSIFPTNGGYPIYKCHRASCIEGQRSGNALTLIRYFEGLIGAEYKEVIKRAGELGYLGKSSYKNKYRINPSDRMERIKTVREQYEKSLEHKDNIKIKNMLERRKIADHVFTTLNGRIGYDPDTDSVVFPIEAPSGGVVAIEKIKAEENDTFKHGNNKFNVGQISKGFFYAGVPINGVFPKIILVEGIMDALSVASVCPQHCVMASIGVGYKKVKKLLAKHLQRKLVVAFDNDEHEAGLNAANSLAKELDRVQIVDYGLFIRCDEEGNLIKTYKDMNEILMDGQDDMIIDILSNPIVVYGISVELEEEGVIYSTKKNPININAFNLAKYIAKKKHILSHDGSSVYIYNGKCYEIISGQHFDSLVSKALKLSMYRELYKGTIRNDFKKFVSDKTYMTDRQDRDEQNRRYLTLQNCLYDLTEGTVIDHTQGIFTTSILPYSYVKDTTTSKDMPNFGKYLITTFERDKEMIGYVQEVMGYILYKGMPRPSLFIGLGQPGCGKSVLLDTSQELVGKQNICSVSPNKFSDPVFVSKMYNKLLNVCGEIDKNSFNKHVEKIKDVSDGGTVTGRNLYDNPYEFKPYCKHIFACNDFPTFLDDTHALYDRIYVIPFRKRFRLTENEIVNYVENYIKPELPAIFNWALAGLKRLKENNFRFSVPEKAENEKNLYMMANDPVHNFLVTCTDRVDDSRTLTRDMKYAYDEFIQFNYEDVKSAKMSSTDFSLAMKAKGIERIKNSRYYFDKIMLNQDGKRYIERNR